MSVVKGKIRGRRLKTGRGILGSVDKLPYAKNE